MPATVIDVGRDPKVGDKLQETLNEKDYSITYVANDTYSVTFSDNTGTLLQARTASHGGVSVPQIGQQYLASDSIGSQLICVKNNPVRLPQWPAIVQVAIEWKNIIPPPPTSSTKWNINVKVSPSLYEQDEYVDVNNKPVVSTAFEFMNPTLKRTYFDDDIRIDFDSSGVDMANIALCKGKYNVSAATMTINGLSRTFVAGTLLFMAPSYETIRVGSPPYDWKNSYWFRYREDGWVDQVADRGMLQLDGSTPPKQIPCTSYGVPVAQPVLLHQGKQKTLPAIGVVATADVLTFDMHGGEDFTGLLESIV
jgi:hypothetical protein